MPVSVSAVVVAHDPARLRMLAAAVASAVAAGADEIVVVRPYRDAIPGQEGRYRDVASADPTLAGKQADGVDAASGEVVAFLDDDDRWKPEKVSVLRERFGARPSLVFLNHAYDVVDETGAFLSVGTPANGRWTLSSNLAMRRAWAVARTALPREAGWEADEVWSFLADLEAPDGIEVLNRSLTLWTYHAENVSRSHRTSAAEFRSAHTRLYARWLRSEEAMVRYARSRNVSDQVPPVARRLRRLAEFRFLSALESGSDPRAAAASFRGERDARPELRRLALLAAVSPGLARYALFRFNRFH